jgi:hypothetical protein
MQPAKINYKIYEGSTFQETFRWESQTKVYVPISTIAKSAPCVVTTAIAHTIPVGWRAKITGAGGMKEINSQSDDDYKLVTAVTSNTIEFNRVNSTGYTAYTSGGIVEYNQPVPLNNYTATMQIRETVDSSTVIHEASTANGQISISTIDSTISINIPSSITRDFDFTTAVYSLELTQGIYVVPFLTGNLTLVREITR